MLARNPMLAYRIIGAEDDSVAADDYDVYDAAASASQHGRD